MISQPTFLCVASPENQFHRRLPMKRLTIMVPVYNEQDVIPLFYSRIRRVIETLSHHYHVDLLFLNNASTDGTLDKIASVREDFANTYVISLSRNVGYQRSLECGLRNAKGDLFVFIDVDCEDPPEMILQFIEKHEQGYDIVFGERVDREEPETIKAARKAFYRILQKVADEDIILDMAEFSLFTAEVRDALVQENTSFPFVRSSISRVGFRRTAIPFKRDKRIAGETHYNLLGMTVFAVAGILSASTLPLRLPLYTLPFMLVGLVVFGALYVVTASPWFALAAAVLAIGHMATSVAFIALYVGRTYKNGLMRPNAFIDRRSSMLQPDPVPQDKTPTPPLIAPALP
ncbi:glycosyltransferase family 2 protein [Azospirillum brasilense]|uniref:Glycosyltransferase n=1 Tax=Azospirillum brasilense TaxID=192 RepID=A0A6L3AS99_AZOBR|nr:glycosyltransferase family 2 protein [Azospirillum brasilense]KAA0677442.1 glycosyltransferase [Azospirillum brasilense]